MLQTYKFLNSKILSIKILKKTDELFLIIYGPFGFTVLKLDNLLIKKKKPTIFFCSN